MKRLFATILFVLTPSLSAQSIVTFSKTYPGQPTAQCNAAPQTPPAVLVGCVDWVNPDAGVIAGWGLDFHTNQTPKGLLLQKLDGVSAPTPFTVIPVARPDVAAALGVNDPTLGFGLLTGPLTPGTYALLYADFPYAWACTADPVGQVVCDFVGFNIVFTVS